MKKHSRRDDYLAMMWLLGGMLGLLAIISLYRLGESSDSDKQSAIKTVNTQIAQRKNTVGALRKNIDMRVADSLARNPKYRYVMENQGRIDSLSRVNDSLLNTAYLTAYRCSIIQPVQRNATVFQDFAHLPAVKNASWKYYKNRKQINEFNQRKATTANLAGDVHRAITDQTQASVAILQGEIDSLLNIKDSLIVQKVR
ncbi:MAG: hypothetical protein IJX89_02825 [Alphaproteobacteria bacterium]|nr:hypothetical protein [Alphaproteobacteria bacterium]